MSLSQRPPEEVDLDAIAELTATALLDSIDAEHLHDMEKLKADWEMLWENKNGLTPQQVFNKLRTRGLFVLRCGGAQVANLTTQANMLNTTVEALLGDAKYLSAPLPYVINEDESITITEE